MMNQNRYPVKKGQQVELVIEKLAFGGKGLARIEDYVIFVPYALPADHVRVKIMKRKPNYAQARLIEILEKSPQRVETPCPYFGWCGGCTLQHLSYQDQIEQKSKQVAESIRQIGGFKEFKMKQIIASPQIWGYRNKMEFSFSDRRWLLPDELKDQSISKNFALGLHIPGTFDRIIDVNYCMLQSEAANQVLNIVRQYCMEKNLQPYGLHSQKGFLRFLVIRQSHANSRIMVNLVTSEKKTELFEALVQRIQDNVPEVASIINTINRQKAQVAFGDEEVVLAGNQKINDQIGTYVFDISASSFFQTNTRQAETLYKVILDFAGLRGKEIVWDLYAGTGTISLFLAQQAKQVIAFELVESAVKDARTNIQRYRMKNITYIAGDLLENLKHVKQKPDVIVIDPPRAGLHPKVCQFLAESVAQRIIYVSCNPTTLARDLQILSDTYRIAEVQPVDMFPHTYHIESVTLLERDHA